MNASIQGIIDYMFKDTVDNAETRALHEELLNNCLEHYDDLICRGMSETEAIDAVVDSLKGMKEVIDEYPKKPNAENEQAAENKNDIPTIEVDQPEKKEPVHTAPSEYVYSVSEIRRIKTELKNCDLEIGLSDDDRIHVRCEDMNQLLCEQDGSGLSIRILDQTKQSIEEAGKKLSNEDFSLKGLLSFIGKAIGSMASGITVSWNVYIDLPAVALAEMNLNSKSGDIEVNAVLPDILTIHSMSGDIEVTAKGRNESRKVSLTAMSGEIEFTGNAETIVMSSMSGDVTAHGFFQDATLKSTSGDTKLIGGADKMTLNSVSGDVTAELRSTNTSSIQAHTTSGDVEIELAPGTESVHSSMSTVSGSTSCRFADSGSGAKLQISAKSVSGDVTIK